MAHQACREVFEELLTLRHWKEMSEILSQVSRENDERLAGEFPQPASVAE